jgi:hypothetical protein
MTPIRQFTIVAIALLGLIAAGQAFLSMLSAALR